jgi:proline iminopeptidase
MVALSYVVKYPQYVKGLLLVTTSPSFRFIEGAKRVLEEKGTPEQREIADVLWRGAFESDEQLQKFHDLLAPMYSTTYNPNPSEEDLQTKLNAQKRMKRSFEALNEGFGGFLLEYDVTDKLSMIQAPTLVIGARHDWITPVEESYVLGENIPDCEWVIFENSSHSVFKDDYDHFHSVAASFLQRRVLSQ